MTIARRVSPFFAALLVIAAPAAAAPPLADADLPLSDLIDAQPRVYHLRVFDAQRTAEQRIANAKTFAFDRRELGTLSVVTRPSRELRGGVELVDVLETDLSTKSVTRVSTSRLDPLLSPRRVEVEAEESGRSAVMRAAMSRGRVEVAPFGDGEPQRHDWPDDTITLSALIRIAERLPREPGSAWSVGGFAELFAFEPIRPARGEAFVLRHAGDEDVTIGRKRYACTLFTLTLAPAGDDVRLWVDERGALRQFAVGSRLRGTLGVPGPIDDDPILAELVRGVEAAEAE